MSWIYIIPALLLSDVLLYMWHWQTFARRYYFLDYGFGLGWLMAYKLGKTE